MQDSSLFTANTVRAQQCFPCVHLIPSAHSTIKLRTAQIDFLYLEELSPLLHSLPDTFHSKRTVTYHLPPTAHKPSSEPSEPVRFSYVPLSAFFVVVVDEYTVKKKKKPLCAFAQFDLLWKVLGTAWCYKNVHKMLIRFYFKIFLASLFGLTL